MSTKHFQSTVSNTKPSKTNRKICIFCLKTIKGLQINDNDLKGKLSRLHDDCFEKIIIKWLYYPKVLPKKKRHYY